MHTVTDDGEVDRRPWTRPEKTARPSRLWMKSEGEKGDQVGCGSNGGPTIRVTAVGISAVISTDPRMTKVTDPNRKKGGRVRIQSPGNQRERAREEDAMGLSWSGEEENKKKDQRTDPLIREKNSRDASGSGDHPPKLDEKKPPIEQTNNISADACWSCPISKAHIMTGRWDPYPRSR